MPTVSGIVKDSSGTPCEALVRVLRRDNMSLVANVFSDPSTGAYSVTTADTSPHVVERYVAPIGDKNALYRRLGLHMSGANNSTAITDTYGHSVTVVGDAKIDAVTTDPYGGTSGILTLDGSGDQLTLASSTDFDIRTNGVSDFTIRFKFKTSQTTAYATLMSREWGGSPPNNGMTIFLRNSASGPLSCWMTGYSTGSPILTGTTTTHGDNNWHDFEWSCSGNVHTMRLDGVQEATTTSSAVQTSASKILVIGNDPTFGGGARAYNGKIKDIEILVGKALHTANFTPPASTFIDYVIGTPTENAQIFDNVIPV